MKELIVAAISGIIQIILLALKNNAEKNAELKGERDALIKEWHDARKNGDRSRMLDVIDRVRKHK